MIAVLIDFTEGRLGEQVLSELLTRQSMERCLLNRGGCRSGGSGGSRGTHSVWCSNGRSAAVLQSLILTKPVSG
jgi:hypothetical protein